MNCPNCQTEVAADTDQLKCTNCGSHLPTIKIDRAESGTGPLHHPSGTSDVLAALGGEDPEPSPTGRDPKMRHDDVLEAGTQIGQYILDGLIGRGGMGVVYKGHHSMLDRMLAVKVLPRDLADDEEFVSRFKREANALAKLRQDNIVQVYDMGVQDGLYYFVMEFVDGVNLGQVLRNKALTTEQQMALIPKVCEALEYAHEEGVVHRDIKPENIILDKNGEPKIADFGLAKIVKGTAGRTLVTQTSTVMGTVDYMAPEQREETKQVDHRADIYSMGVMIYEILTGGLPIGRFAAPSQRAKVDSRLDGVVLRALENEPALRFQSAAELGRAISRITKGEMEPVSGELNLGRCLNDALLVYRHNWGKMIGMYAIVTLMTGLSCGILAGAAQGAYLLVALRALRRRDRTVRFQDMLPGFKRWAALLGAFILVGIGTALGLVLLIIPGLILGTWWMFALYYVLERRRGPIQAMLDSRRLVKTTGFGACFVLWLLSLLVTVGPQGLPYIASVQEIPTVGRGLAQALGGLLSMIFAPISLLMVASGWNQLTRTAIPVYEACTDPRSRKWPGVAIALVLVAVSCMVVFPLVGVVASLLIPDQQFDVTVMMNHGAAKKSLRQIHRAQEKFRRDDLDQNGEADYWTGTISDLRDMKIGGKRLALISRSLANADSSQENPASKDGYLFGTVERPEGFGVVAWPENYPDSGKRTYIINEEGKIYRIDNGGKLVDRWPSDAQLKSEWERN